MRKRLLLNWSVDNSSEIGSFLTSEVLTVALCESNVVVF